MGDRPKLPDWFAQAWQHCRLRLKGAGQRYQTPGGQPRHWTVRDTWVLITVKSGLLQIQHPSRNLQLRAGESLLASGMRSFRQLPSLDNLELMIANILLSGTDLAENPLLRLPQPLVLQAGMGPDEYVHWEAILGSCRPDWQLYGTDQRIFADAHLSLLLQRLLAVTLALVPDVPAIPQEPVWMQRLDAALTGRSVFEPMTVAGLAKELGLTPAHLGQGYRHYRGRTLVATLRDRRLQLAQSLLRSDDQLPVAEVARRCRYADASRLARAFSRKFGCSPGEWRRGTTAKS